MWEILTRTLIPLWIFNTSAIAQYTNSDHLVEIKSKYPYGLLNDDYGVLTVNDLALNACHIKPEPFIPGALNPYEYWLCFDSKNVWAVCDDQNFSNEDGRVGRVIVKAKNHKIAYHFIEARPWPIQDCKGFVKKLQSLVQGTSHACISASYISKEKNNERTAIFHRLKTHMGCEGEECVFTEKIKREYCPGLKS